MLFGEIRNGDGCQELTLSEACRTKDLCRDYPDFRIILQVQELRIRSLWCCIALLDAREALRQSHIRTLVTKRKEAQYSLHDEWNDPDRKPNGSLAGALVEQCRRFDRIIVGLQAKNVKLAEERSQLEQEIVKIEHDLSVLGRPTSFFTAAYEI